MTKRITHKTCKYCGVTFEYSHKKQMFCTINCSFFDKVITKGGECWEWTGSKHNFGYGDFRFDNTYYRAHVFAFDKYIGGRDPKQHVLHKCDNPSCCNPAHLFVGNQKTNMEDMAKKGRSGQRKLTDAQVKNIKILFKHGNYSYTSMGRYFNVSHNAIRNICIGKTYKHIVP